MTFSSRFSARFRHAVLRGSFTKTSVRAYSRQARLGLIGCALFALPGASEFALAQLSGGAYEITRSTIDGGGQTSAGGAFALSGTVGQADAGTIPATGGGYALAGGFWVSGAAMELIFSNGFEDR